jgi:hypothetical protein
MSAARMARCTVLSVLVAVLPAAPALAGFAGTDVFLPMAGRQAGVFPSNWYTTIWIYNPGAAAATARVYFLQRNTANPTPPHVDVPVAAGETAKLDNVVETLFHLQVFGALRVTCEAQKLLVTSRVYSKSPSAGETDSVGQDFAAVPASFAIGAGEKAQVLGVSQVVPSTSPDFRFNFGFVETTGHTATVHVTLLDESGSSEGEADLQVREWSQRQVALKDWFSNVPSANSRIEVEVSSGSQGRVIAYGSSIANGSQDPTTFEMSYKESLLGIATVQHDATLSGDGTAAAPLGIAPSATAGQILATVATGGATPAQSAEAAAAGTGVAWQSLGTLPLGLSAGGVTFGGASGALAQDAPTLYWDAAGKRLGIGLTAPRDRLDVAGNIRISDSSADTGKIIIGDYWFLHGYGVYNTFVGPSAGNFTLTGAANTGVGSGSLLHATTGTRNAAVGASALWADTTGFDNTAVGNEAMKLTTTGNTNTAVGAQALKNMIIGSGNTAVGAAALSSAQSGNDNTAVGSQSMTMPSTGYANTAVGAYTLRMNSTGFNNVAVGVYSLNHNTSGDGATAAGVASLYSNVSGANNSAFGYGALYSNTTGGQNTAVGSSALFKNVGAQGNTAVGHFSLYENISGNNNTAVGMDAMLKNTSGGHNVAVGAFALAANTEGTLNCAVGPASLTANTVGSSNTAVGASSLASSVSGVNNTAVGQGTLNATVSSGYNTAVGYQALYADTTGNGNTAVGSTSLTSNTSGEGNAALGATALLANTIGSRNTAVGAGALRESTEASDSTAVGYQALNASIGAGANTAVGASSLLHNTSGVENVAVGRLSLAQNTGGGGNTAVGSQALATANAASNTAIGALALFAVATGAANTAVGNSAGYSAQGSGNVFIGNLAGYSEAGSNRLYIANASSGALIYGQFDNRRVGIDTTGPTATLDVNGQVRARTWSGSSATPVCRDATGVLVPCASDARLKRNVVPLAGERDVLALLAGLRAVSFDWDSPDARPAGEGTRDIGFIAQEVERVLPEVVHVEADGYRSMDYAKLTALLVEAAKAQQREIEALKAEVAALRR